MDACNAPKHYVMAPLDSSMLVWQEMEAVIRQRFGAHGLRVFRLLLLHPQLEQKQIAEKAMLPPKVAFPLCT